MQIWFQSFFSKCVNMPLLTHFEKECVFFKVRWLGSKFNALWNFVSKCAIFQVRCNNPDLCRYYELHKSMCDINLQSPVSHICKKKNLNMTKLIFLCFLVDGNTNTKYQLANTKNTVPDRWNYMYQDCIYVGNSGKLIIWNYDFQTINECTLVQLMDDQHIYGVLKVIELIVVNIGTRWL